MGSVPDILLGGRLPQQPLFASSIRRKVIWCGCDARYVSFLLLWPRAKRRYSGGSSD
jgi:hypothetical protein